MSVSPVVLGYVLVLIGLPVGAFIAWLDKDEAREGKKFFWITQLVILAVLAGIHYTAPLLCSLFILTFLLFLFWPPPILLLAPYLLIGAALSQQFSFLIVMAGFLFGIVSIPLRKPL
ncbi:MAG: hypothetical protein H6502_04360 [Candidatus Woesearchaeota archaeon]|nr:MAG: hypothetical protein H6502_04360 [Candidatus Woesearchaeota archaeon]